MVACHAEFWGWIGEIPIKRSSLTFWHASSTDDSISCTFMFFASGRQRKEAVQWLDAAIVQCMAKNKLAKPRLESLLTPKPLGHSPKPTNFGGRKNNLCLAADFRFRSNRMGSLIGEKRCLGNKCLHVLGRVTTSLTRQEECLLGSQNVSWIFWRRKNLFLRFISFTTTISEQSR